MKLLQAILFRYPRSSRLGPVVWSAFKEVEASLSRFAGLKAEYQRYYLGVDVPDSLKGEANPECQQGNLLLTDEFWDSERVRGAFDETFEVEPVIMETRALIAAAAQTNPLVVVTDVEISPIPRRFSRLKLGESTEDPGKPEWAKYKFFEIYKMDGLASAIISLCPMDPDFWSGTDSGSALEFPTQADLGNIGKIAQRVRAACFRETAQLLANSLQKCGTRNCFLQHPVESPATLDRMSQFCNKHGLREIDPPPNLSDARNRVPEPHDRSSLDAQLGAAKTEVMTKPQRRRGPHRHDPLLPRLGRRRDGPARHLQ